MKHKIGTILLFIGGICMIISSAIGSIGVYEFLYDYVSTEVPPEIIPILKAIIVVLRVIAYTGGYAIILGTIFILFNQYRLGKFFIGLGLTFGSIALIIWIIVHVIDFFPGLITDPEVLAYLDRLYDQFTYNTGLAFTGVVVAIIGRMAIKKPKKEKIEGELEEEEEIFEEPDESYNNSAG
ncbi:MAG: hypothetical protein ACFE9T_09825 [Promethearchaeota archaeon]